MFKHHHVALIGKAVQKAARLRGGGSALPGLVVEKLDPRFVARVLEHLPYGVVIVSGTNGKTTTTKAVAQLLHAAGLNVFTNKTGSNFIRGIAAALLTEVDEKGILHADVAVLELDEAHAVRFIKHVAPRHVLLLNVMRDQLDRFGEIDHTAKLLETVALAATESVVLNREDTLVRAIASKLPSDIAVHYFGLDSSLHRLFPNDHDLYGTDEITHSDVPAAAASDVILADLQDTSATFRIGKKEYPPAVLQLEGAYNVFNAAAAIAIARAVLDDPKKDAVLLDEITRVTPAFGRGETIMHGDRPIEIVLVKNPAGFRLALSSYAKRPARTMIAINDNYADGRDMSWLWDVDFSSLKGSGVAAVSGVRAYDMALRLQYDEVLLQTVDTSLAGALHTFLDSADPAPMRIYCTYTAMLALRRLLNRTHLEES